MKVKRCGRCDNALSVYWQHDLCLHCLWQVAELCAEDERKSNAKLRDRVKELEAEVAALNEAAACAYEALTRNRSGVD